MLLESSFDLMLLTHAGMSALHLACLVENPEACSLIVSHLLEGGYRKSFIGKVFNQVNPYLHISPLSAALIAGNKSQAIELIHSGASIYLSESDNLKNLSPIFISVYLQQLDILEQICDVHTDLRFLNSRRQTPIMVACYQKKL